jgi:hypothetical protein
MIITDSKGDGGGYSIDDPWTSNTSPFKQGAATTSSRPLTWAPSSANDDRNSTYQYQSSEVGEEGADAIKLPATFERAWELSRDSEQSDPSGISLSQLGKVVRSAKSLGAADVERVST